MAKCFTLNSIFCLVLLATTLTLATSARILDEDAPLFPGFPASSVPISPPEKVAPGATALPSGQIPAETAPTEEEPPMGPVVAPVATPIEEEPVAPVVAPEAAPIEEEPVAPVVAKAAPVEEEPVAPATTKAAPVEEEPVAPVVAPDTTKAAPVEEAPVAPVVAPNTPKGAATTGPMPEAGTFSFFMHDILGGSHPSGRAVAGIVANSDANNLPFSKPSNPIFPINGGVPLNTINNAINNNNYPFLVGLNGAPSSTLVQSNGNNAVASGNDNSQAFVTAGQLPQGLTLNQLTFGSVTVVDNEITEGHELGSGVLGRVQGIYITSSSDGSSHTLALTAAFHGHEHEGGDDNISFFGVHRTATPMSHIAIVGGTGKYENAKGFAAIETMPHVDQHTTDGIETVTHFTVYITP